jgi:signal transduction histidine kinase
MDRMVRDVLNFSNTMRGRLPLENVDVRSLLNGILETYPQLSQDHVEVVMEGGFFTVQANAAALGQCFSNIISNAIKFVTPGKHPRVRIWSEKIGALVRIHFEDNGIGIPVEQRERIFNLFYRLDKSRGGTGVGLAVVRKAVQRMGGQVGVQAGSDGGSCFWIELTGGAA